MKVLPRHGQEENLNLQEDKAVKACNSLRGGRLGDRTGCGCDVHALVSSLTKEAGGRRKLIAIRL
jgi:hypothetical protein